MTRPWTPVPRRTLVHSLILSVVLFVVAADEGWRRQSTEHLAAIDALGLTHGLLAVTRSDLSDPGPATEQALSALASSSLGRVASIAVSGTSGAGLPELRAALDALVGSLPVPDAEAPVRLWVDRSFTVRGAGTVVTGTLAAGTLRSGQSLTLHGRTLRVRGLQSLGQPVDEVRAVGRVAVNLRDVAPGEVGRGDALLSGTWRLTDSLDVRLSNTDRFPEQLVLHVGTAALAVRVRPLGDGVARLTLSGALPLRAGDRAVLRDPAEQRVAAGALVLDADPPALRRRGAAVVRASELSAGTGNATLGGEVGRRGFLTGTELAALGVTIEPTAGVRRIDDWWVSEATWQGWVAALLAAVDRHAAQHPLEAGLPGESARQAIGLPDASLLAPLIVQAGLEHEAGRVRRPGAVPSLGPAESSLELVEKRLENAPFAAPETPELRELGLGPRELAAAETAGRLLRLGGDVVLLPTAPARAMQVLAALPQPFTTSQARQALGTSRRVAVPLLEHLDRRGWTVRVDDGLRRVAG